jgi:hypothetical protein
VKGKALRRALATTDVLRVNADIPLITDTTELVTPQVAEEMLKKNKRNRPVNWRKVEEFSSIMRAGQWKLHSQGIILDPSGNILTGQTRLWAVVYSDTPVYLRISRNNPASVAKLIDRGRPQSARDLATRDTEKKHSPTESSIARAICALAGNLRPSTDSLADAITANTQKAEVVLAETSGTKKTKSVLMIMAAICYQATSESQARLMAMRTREFADRLESALIPQTAESCWGKGAAFSLALTQAKTVIS